MDVVIIYFIIFFIIFILNSIGSKFYTSGKKREGYVFIISSFLLLLCFIGFRMDVGTDYKSYLSIQNLVSRLQWDQLKMISWEYGVSILFKITSIFFADPKIIFVVLAFFTIFPIYKINKYYDYKYLSYSILTFCFIFLPFSMNGMRQAVAMSYISLSVVCMLKNKKISSLFYFIISFLFHNTSLIMLPYLILLFFCKSKKISKYTMMLTALISILLLFFASDLIGMNIMSSYSSYLLRIDIDNISLSNFILYLPIILMILVLHKEKTKESNYLKTIIASGMILDVIGTSSRYLSRISLYFTFFEILYIPYLLNNIKDKTNRNFIKILYIIYLILYFIVQFYILGKHEIFPYQNWLFMG